jgi:hypothetical protein
MTRCRVQYMIEQTGWRTACTVMGILIIVACADQPAPYKRPETSVSCPTAISRRRRRPKPVSNIVDPVWANTDWTWSLAMRTARFGDRRLFLRPVHLVRRRCTRLNSADMASSDRRRLGAGTVSLLGIPGQIWLGYPLTASAKIGVGDCLLRLRHRFAALVALK